MKDSPSNVFDTIVLWFIWLGLFSALPMYWAFLRQEPGDADSSVSAFMLTMLIVPIAISTWIRWSIIPRLPKLISIPSIREASVLPLIIVGGGIGESLCFFGFFFFPHYQEIFFGAAVLMVGQYIPIKLIPTAEPPPLPANA